MSRQSGNPSSYGGSRNVNNPGRSGGGGGGGGGSRTCNYCHETGHYVRDCPKLKSGGGRRSGEPGHPAVPPAGGGVEARGPNRDSSRISQEMIAEINEGDTLVSKFSSVERTGVQKPYRPSYGTMGDRVELQTNYFQVNLPSERSLRSLHRYTVNIEPKFDEKGKKLPEPKNKKLKQIIRLLLDHFKSLKLGILVATDFKSILICSGEIPQTSWSAEIKYYHESDSGTRDNPPTYRVRIEEPLPPLDISVLKEFLASKETVTQYQDREPMLQALNILLGHHSKSTRTTIMVGGNKAFPTTDSKEKVSLTAYLEALRGFFLSVRLATFRAVVNVNVSHAAFYKVMTLPELIESCGLNPLKTGNWLGLEIFLRGLKVRTDYLRDATHNPITQVRSIKWFASENDGGENGPSPYVEEFAAPPARVWFYFDGRKDFGEQEYMLEDSLDLRKDKNIRDKYISVEEFFRIRHNIMSDPRGRYPVINFGSRGDPTYVPAEACTVEPGQLGKLNPHQTESMINFAVRRPALNVASIKKSGLPALGLSPEAPEIAGFGFGINPEMIDVPGRMLSLPTVYYKNNTTPTPVTGGWNLIQMKFKDPVPNATDTKPIQWGCLRLDESRPNFDFYASAISDFKKNLGNCGISLKEPWKLRLDNQSDGYRDKKGKGMEKRIQEALPREVQKLDILLVILPAKDTALYNRIKRYFDRFEGIHTVCVVGSGEYSKDGKYVGKGFYKIRNGTYFGNVALKFNLKLGGTNHTLGKVDMGILSEGKTMVVGIDVVHPSPGSGKASIASMVASIDKDLAQWPVDLQVQVREGQEMLDRISDMLKSRLLLWKKHKDVYPENILVYRDGVSESQYQQVLDSELKDMQQASASLYDAVEQSRPRFSLIIVGKRHHTRFYPRPGHHCADENGNPKRGLVVDRGITEARNWDFFLQSHNAIKGTARPAHYYVLWDEIFTKVQLGSDIKPADALERLTHSLCYLFSRAAKAVSIPAPVYYADIACERAGRYLADNPSDSESMKTDKTTMTAGERAKVRNDLQEKIKVHDDLKDDMFYV